MGYSQSDLESKIIEMYPVIKEHNIAVSMSFSEEESAWIIKLKKDIHELTTHLKKKDADECLEGKKCVYLGVQVGEFVDNFERI
jgi:hypothetical protein